MNMAIRCVSKIIILSRTEVQYSLFFKYGVSIRRKVQIMSFSIQGGKQCVTDIDRDQNYIVAPYSVVVTLSHNSEFTSNNITESFEL